MSDIAPRKAPLGAEDRAGAPGLATEARICRDPMLIVITGPIASGKSTLARAVAREFGDRGMEAAAVDLDLIYEMIDPSGSPKDDEKVWRRARRASARLAETLLAEGLRVVVVEGDFASPAARSEFTEALDHAVVSCVVTLLVSLETALKRVQLDPSRGISRDSSFLRNHYRTTARDLKGAATIGLAVDTEAMTVAESARTVADWVLDDFPQ
jgi:chloramphenicol 3-O-phosphotransferase